VERLGSSDLTAATAADSQQGERSRPRGHRPAAGGGPDLADLDGPPVWTDEAIAALSHYPAYRKTLELMYLGMKKGCRRRALVAPGPDAEAVMAQ